MSKVSSAFLGYIKAIGGSIVNLADKEGKVRLGLAVETTVGLNRRSSGQDSNSRINLGVTLDRSGALDFEGENESRAD